MSYTRVIFGPKILEDGSILFSLWAPAVKTVDLMLFTEGEWHKFEMHKDENEWFSLRSTTAKVGDLYKFRLDGDMQVPDPASKFQPDDVHGASAIVSSEFDWGDTTEWKGLPWPKTIIYELHIGTFTNEGTFQAAVQKLDYLAALGITAIEIMPVADFPGKYGWGYDGVAIFAPDSTYGRPEDLKTFIREAHSRNIMVFLDVVYNHFGPEGNYLYCYTKDKFFDKRKKTPWGEAINFNNQIVREFFIANALYWLDEFRFDGLRLDAAHAFMDKTEVDILQEIAFRVRDYFPKDRHIHLMLENDANQAKYLVRPVNSNSTPQFYNAQWNDDFHHCLHILSTHEKDGYYDDYVSGDSDKSTEYFLGRALTQGFAYQGEVSAYRNNLCRGDSCKDLPIDAFINFIQNHDQVGNRAFGERLSMLVNPKMYRALACLYLLAPSVPMLFMGEEWASDIPFLYFCNFEPSLVSKVREGRRKEFKKFAAFKDKRLLDMVPDPSSPLTFKESKLQWAELNEERHKKVFEFYKSLIRIRKDKISPLISAISDTSFQILSKDSILASWRGEKFDLNVYANFSDKAVSIKTPVYGDILFESCNGAAESIIRDNTILPESVCWFLKRNIYG